MELIGQTVRQLICWINEHATFHAILREGQAKRQITKSFWTFDEEENIS